MPDMREDEIEGVVEEESRDDSLARAEEVKACTKCNYVYLLSRFINARTRSGKGSICMQCNRGRNNERNRASRVKVLAHYGGGVPKCACCGDLHLEFLSLDHIHGGGRQHRKTIKIRWWEWIIKNNYPKEFRVLCHNCNQAIGLYGYCPHQQEESQLLTAFNSYDENAPNKSFKLSWEQVDEIRREIDNGVTQCSLALKYRVSRATICLINRGKHWGDAHRGISQRKWASVV